MVMFLLNSVVLGVQILEVTGRPLFDHSEEAIKFQNLCSSSVDQSCVQLQKYFVFWKGEGAFAVSELIPGVEALFAVTSFGLAGTAISEADGFVLDPSFFDPEGRGLDNKLLGEDICSMGEGEEARYDEEDGDESGVA